MLLLALTTLRPGAAGRRQDGAAAAAGTRALPARLLCQPWPECFVVDGFVSRKIRSVRARYLDRVVETNKSGKSSSLSVFWRQRKMVSEGSWWQVVLSRFKKAEATTPEGPPTIQGGAQALMFSDRCAPDVQMFGFGREQGVERRSASKM